MILTTATTIVHNFMASYLFFFALCVGFTLVNAQTCNAVDYNNCVQAHYNCPMDTQEQTCQCYINY